MNRKQSKMLRKLKAGKKEKRLWNRLSHEAKGTMRNIFHAIPKDERSKLEFYRLIRSLANTSWNSKTMNTRGKIGKR